MFDSTPQKSPPDARSEARGPRLLVREPLRLVAANPETPFGLEGDALEGELGDLRKEASGRGIRLLSGAKGDGPVRHFRITGVGKLGGADLGGLTIAAFDVPTAQAVLNKPGRFDEIDIAAAPVLDEAFRVALLRADLIVVDLREVRFIDSTGVRLLTAAARRVRRAGGQMTLEALPPHVTGMLAFLGDDTATASAPREATPFPQ